MPHRRPSGHSTCPCTGCTSGAAIAHARLHNDLHTWGTLRPTLHHNRSGTIHKSFHTYHSILVLSPSQLLIPHIMIVICVVYYIYIYIHNYTVYNCIIYNYNILYIHWHIDVYTTQILGLCTDAIPTPNSTPAPWRSARLWNRKASEGSTDPRRPSNGRVLRHTSDRGVRASCCRSNARSFTWDGFKDERPGI